MRYFIGHILLDTFMGRGESIIVKADTLEEAEDKIYDYVKEGVNYPMGCKIMRRIDEVEEKDLEVIEKYCLAELHYKYSELE